MSALGWQSLGTLMLVLVSPIFNGVFIKEMVMRASDDKNRMSRLHLSYYVSTYFVAGLEALGFNTSVRVGVDSDTGLVLGSKDIIDLANELFVLSPDHTGEQGNGVALDHTDNLSFTVVGNLSDNVESLGRASIVTTYNKSS